MGEYPNQLSDGKQERPAHRASIEDEFEVRYPDAHQDLAKRALEMADLREAPRSRYVPRLSVSMTPETRRSLKEEVASTITKYLSLNGQEYAKVGGLGRLITRVSEATGWTKSDVYTLALKVAKGVEFNVVEGTIRALPVKDASTQE